MLCPNGKRGEKGNTGEILSEGPEGRKTDRFKYSRYEAKCLVIESTLPC